MNKRELTAKISHLNRENYKARLLLLNSYYTLCALVNKQPKPPRPLICTNEKNYLGSTERIISTILLLLRDDTDVFKMLISYVDTSTDCSEAYLQFFADELTLVLFADFFSSNNSDLRILHHLTSLLQVNYFHKI